MNEEMTPLRGSRVTSATELGTGFNMFKNIVGAGLLGLPYAVAQMGLVGFLFMAYSATVSVIALYFIAASIDLCEKQGVHKPYSYKSIAAAAFGPGTGAMLDVIVLCYTGLELVAYGVLIIDFFRPPLLLWLGDWIQPQMILAAAGTIVFGLCCLPSMEALKYSSMLGNLALLYAVLLVIYEWLRSPIRVSADVTLIDWTPEALRVVGIYTSAFNLHYNMPIYFAGIQPCPPRRMMSVVLAVYGVVIVFYAPLALCGYLMFGDAVQSNVLRNFGPETRFLVCRLALGLMVMCTFPVITVCTRDALSRLLFGHDTDVIDHTTQVSLSLLIVAVACWLAFIVPSFGVVLAYNGAIFGTLQQLIFPAFAFFVLSKKSDLSGRQRVLAAVIGLLGIAVATTGTVTQTLALLGELRDSL